VLLPTKSRLLAITPATMQVRCLGLRLLIVKVHIENCSIFELLMRQQVPLVFSFYLPSALQLRCTSCDGILATDIDAFFGAHQSCCLINELIVLP